MIGGEGYSFSDNEEQQVPDIWGDMDEVEFAGAIEKEGEPEAGSVELIGGKEVLVRGDLCPSIDNDREMNQKRVGCAQQFFENNPQYGIDLDEFYAHWQDSGYLSEAYSGIFNKFPKADLAGEHFCVMADSLIGHRIDEIYREDEELDGLPRPNLARRTGMLSAIYIRGQQLAAGEKLGDDVGVASRKTREIYEREPDYFDFMDGVVDEVAKKFPDIAERARAENAELKRLVEDYFEREPFMKDVLIKGDLGNRSFPLAHVVGLDLSRNEMADPIFAANVRLAPQSTHFMDKEHEKSVLFHELGHVRDQIVNLEGPARAIAKELNLDELQFNGLLEDSYAAMKNADRAACDMMLSRVDPSLYSAEEFRLIEDFAYRRDNGEQFADDFAKKVNASGGATEVESRSAGIGSEIEWGLFDGVRIGVTYVDESGKKIVRNGRIKGRVDLGSEVRLSGDDGSEITIPAMAELRCFVSYAGLNIYRDLIAYSDELGEMLVQVMD